MHFKYIMLSKLLNKITIRYVTKAFCWRKRVLNLILDIVQIQPRLIHLRKQGRLQVSKVCIWRCVVNGLHCDGKLWLANFCLVFIRWSAKVRYEFPAPKIHA